MTKQNNSINSNLLNKTKNLKRLFEMRALPFYTKAENFSAQDSKDRAEYRSLEKQLESETKKLKKGDKVVFNFPDKVRNKASMFGCDYIPHFYEGEVKNPAKRVKRTRMGEDASFESINIVCGKYIYPTSLTDVEKI
jgi:hypothetical protein